MSDPRLSRFADILTPPNPVKVTSKGTNRLYELLNKSNQGTRLLNVGSGPTRYTNNIINLDFFLYPNVDVVGDSISLPFRSETFAVIICKALLEHIVNPTQAVKEIHRVLKKGGIVYVEIPFLQGFHATSTYSDFQRYTISGIQELFREFQLIEKGVVAGPSSALTWTLREFLAIFLSFNSIFLYRLFSLFFGWLTLPLKHLDYFLENNRFAHTIASGFFLIGKK